MITDEMINEAFIRKIIDRDRKLIYKTQEAVVRANFPHGSGRLADHLAAMPFDFYGSMHWFKILPYLRFLDIRYRFDKQLRRDLALYNRVIWGVLYNETLPDLKYGLTQDILKGIREELEQAGNNEKQKIDITMAKKLTEDQINWILNVDASDAQQEIHKLTKANKELTKANKERSAELRKLEAQGKTESDEYKNLVKEMKKASTVIKGNNKVMGELEKTLGITGLTMSQLRKKAKDLQRQLDNTSKSANPKEYKALENRLGQVRQRIDELRTSGRRASNEMTNFEKGMSKVKTAAKIFIAVKLWQYLKNIAMQAYNTRKEFAKYEAVLKNATGSAKAAGDAMGMIQKLAADTPASVAEWTQAYIKLINRGIKPTTAELIKLGDTTTSQGKDLDQYIEAVLDAMTGENERLKEFGIRARKNGETTAFTFKGVTTEVQNTEGAIYDYLISLGELEGVHGSMAVQMEELAGLESNLGDQMDSIYNKIGKRLEPMLKSFFGFLGGALGGISGMLDTTTDRFNNQFDKVVTLRTELPNLVARYDELKSKAHLNVEEQDELYRVMKDITAIVPGAAAEWDEYGKMIAINTGKVDEYIKEQQLLLTAMNDTEISKAEKEANDALKKIEKYKKKIAAGGEFSYVFQSGGSTFNKWSDQQMAEFNAIIDKESKIYEGKMLYIDELTGKSLEKRIADKQKELELTKKLNEEEAGGGGGNGAAAALQQQKELFEQKRLELKERYLQGDDENLQTRSQYNAAMEQLLIDDLQARLAIMGLEKEERRKLEEQLLDIRIKAMEDFKKKKDEMDAEDKSLKLKSDEEYMTQMQASGALTMKNMQKENEDRTKLIEAALNKQVETYKGYGMQMGNALGQVLSGQEDMLSAFGGTVIDIMFDVLGQIINQKITEATAVAVAEQAKAAAISAAQPDSVVTFGATAVARTAIIGGLIMASLTAAKTALKGLLTRGSKQAVTTDTYGNTTHYTRIPGKASGGYFDVTRAQDGRHYSAEYNPGKRGYVSSPTVLVGESGREWVASNAAVSNPTVAPILDILDRSQAAGTIRTLDLTQYLQGMRMAGRADGGTFTPGANVPMVQSPMDDQLLARILAVLESLDRNGVHSSVYLSEIQSAQELLNKSRSIGSK